MQSHDDIRPLLTLASSPVRTIAANLIVLVHADFPMRPGITSAAPGKMQ